MKRRDIVVGVVAIGLLLVLYNRISNNSQPPVLDNEDVPIESVQKDLEDILGRTLPESSEKHELKAATGHEGRGVVGIGEDGMVSILADLPTPENSAKYQVWEKRKDIEDPVLVGYLDNVKGGWLLDYTSPNKDNIEQVQITLNGELVMSAVLN